MKTLPTVAAVIEEGIGEGLHVGAQVAVSVGGELIADVAVGSARPGVPMSTDTLMVWFSSTKAVTAVAALQQWDRGAFDLDDRVTELVPEFRGGGKEAVTVRHLLTHTAGLRYADRLGEGAMAVGGGMTGTWDERTERICAAEVEAGWVPGRKAGYHPTAGMHMLGEIVQRVDGRPFAQYVRDEILVPLGMNDCWVGMPPETYDSYGDRIGFMHRVGPDGLVPLPAMDTRDSAASSVPGAGGRGPARELLRLYRMLLGKGELDGVRVLSRQAVEAMTARHRVGMFDHSFGAPVDWGLGLIFDTWHFGSYNSPRAFGHAGAASSVGFADPEHDLAVGLVFNGMAPPDRHSARMAAVSSAIYRDLGLVDPDAEPREKAQFQTRMM